MPAEQEPVVFRKYRIVEGMHMHGQELLKKGDELVSGDDLVKLYGPKFEFIEEVPAPGQPAPEAKKAKA